MKEKVIIDIGKCWEDNWQTITKEYEIVCCVDKNVEKKLNRKVKNHAK